MLGTVIVVNVVISLAVLVGGYYLKFHTSSSVDSLIGFKTKRAMASNEAWRFANYKCGQLWFIIGTLGFALTGAAAIYIQPKLSDNACALVYLLILILQIALIPVSIVRVEAQLKEKYDKGE